MKIIRTVFHDHEPRRFTLVLDMEESAGLMTSGIPGLIEKMELALPGVFPEERDPLSHTCGGGGTGVPEHAFREELERGTDIPHLLEHVLLHLLSRRTCACSAFCGQRSSDLDRGITTHHYLIIDCPSQLEAVVAVEIAFGLVSAWVEGRTVTINPQAVLDGIERAIGPMVGG